MYLSVDIGSVPELWPGFQQDDEQIINRAPTDLSFGVGQNRKVTCPYPGGEDNMRIGKKHDTFQHKIGDSYAAGGHRKSGQRLIAQ